MAQAMIDYIGGEDALRKLVEDFYDIVEYSDDGVRLRTLHIRGHGLDHARVEQFNFLSGFLGGRRYYEEKHGHMDVRLMHAHVPISIDTAEDWLKCMDQALADNGLKGPEIDRLRAILRRICMMLVNDLTDWGVRASA
ncbi:group II truncated hemoglobin [Defluviimonas sp. WL0050]|uniref:Group II truncated hemoglobin n=1 Tax=Albidovulum litorale TaxID=2984134 RepID=A0ABT2ZN13_9RHOB|nr:group II truncated hemoglobin [Defluviimonas sp. WL0050]MCV2872502.1 group II truncated hemoglobin [Defluviimonas sp. WL0050]